MNAENTSEQSSPVDYAGSGLNLRETIDLILSGRWWIVLSVAIGLLLGTAHGYLPAPTYIADGTVQVEQNTKGLASATHDIMSLLTGESSATQAEVQILQSRLVLSAVIEKLKLDIDVKPKIFPLIGGAIVRARAGRPQPAPELLWFSSYAWGGEKVNVTSFEVPEALIGAKMYLQAASDNGFVLLDGLHTRLLDGKVGDKVEAATSYGNIRIFVQELRARPGTEFTLVRRSLGSVLGEFASNYTVKEAGKETGVIRLTMQGPTPAYVASVIREVENVYVRQNIERRSEEAGQSLDYLLEQLPQLKNKVDTAHSRLNDYQTSRGSVNVSKETDLILDQATTLETQRLGLVVQREQNLQHFTPQHPVIQALDAQIAEIDKALADVKKRTLALPQTQQDLFELNLEVSSNSDLYSSLLSTIQQLQVSKAGTVGDVRVVDYPLPPLSPSKPNKTLEMALGLLGGLFGGVLLVYLQRALLRGVDQPEEIERKLGLATYAIVPYVEIQRRIDRAGQRNAPGSHILAVSDSSSIAVESIRSLRSSLHFAMLETGNNVVMIAGPTPGLGKSFITINLAVVLAAIGKRVVVVDADLRRGHLHRTLGMSESPGVSDFVAGESDIATVVRPTEVDGMFFVGRGAIPPNPSELLLHERFGDLINHLDKNFDYVMVDTAPVLPVADAMIVGRLAGCVLLVLKAAAHPMREIEETLRRLNRAGINPKGIVFNQMGARAGSYGYGGYGYNYASEYRSSE